MLVLHYLLVSLLFFFQTSLSQTTECTYLCPPEDELGQILLKQPLAIPYQSDYSIFECVYGEVTSDPHAHNCFYAKSDGKQTLGGQGNQCPFQALPCSDGPGKFSSYSKAEVPAWIENGKFLLYQKENHP